MLQAALPHHSSLEATGRVVEVCQRGRIWETEGNGERSAVWLGVFSGSERGAEGWNCSVAGAAWGCFTENRDSPGSSYPHAVLIGQQPHGADA